MFIVFEGGDGSGKSSQARLLCQKLRREGCPALLTREPGGSPLGESLRRLLKRRRAADPLAELFLFAAARAQLVNTVIRPALAQGATVVCDRFTASTVAYQGYGRGLPLDVIAQVNALATGGLVPDLIVFLDLPPETALARLGKLAASDTFDAAPLAFHRRVREGYLAQARQDPARWLVADAAPPKAAIAAALWQKIQPLL